jgi:hypothetical protein
MEVLREALVLCAWGRLSSHQEMHIRYDFGNLGSRTHKIGMPLEILDLSDDTHDRYPMRQSGLSTKTACIAGVIPAEGFDIDWIVGQFDAIFRNASVHTSTAHRPGVSDHPRRTVKPLHALPGEPPPGEVVHVGSERHPRDPADIRSQAQTMIAVRMDNFGTVPSDKRGQPDDCGRVSPRTSPAEPRELGNLHRNGKLTRPLG